MNAFKNIAGCQFGALKAIEFHKRENRLTWWKCLCNCGKEFVARRDRLLNGVTVSCGCQHSRESHGQGSARTITREYQTWVRMIDRCENKNNRSFYCYGERGVSICRRWRDSFSAFFADMGTRPSSKHSLDRINNDGNYEPGNCRWATRAEQAQNRRTNSNITLSGNVVCIEEAARRLRIVPATFRKWVYKYGQEKAIAMAN